MTGVNWRQTKRVFDLLMQGFVLAGLLTLVGFAWCIRKTATPAAKIAASTESWALEKLAELRSVK